MDILMLTLKCTVIKIPRVILRTETPISSSRDIYRDRNHSTATFKKR